MELFEEGSICQLSDARKIKKGFSLSLKPFDTDLVYFTTRVPDTSDMRRHECDMSAT